MDGQAISAAGRVLTFSVAGRAYSVPVGEVREVARRPSLTRVPQGPPALAGLMNFHGVAIPVVRMSAMLGLAASASDAGPVVVFGDGPVGLLVDGDIRLNADAGGSRALDVSELLATNFPVRTAARTTVERARATPGKTAAGEEVISIFAFEVAGQRFAMPLEAIVECLTLPPQLTLLPRADRHVVGMLDWRGGVLPLISLAELLGLRATTSRSSILVTRLGKSIVGLVCGPVDGVSRIPVSAVEAVPAILQRGEGDAEIEAIARAGHGAALISILSPKKLFHNRDIGQVLESASAGGNEVQSPSGAAPTAQLLIFRLGEEMFGLPLGAVAEIVQLPETLTRVPRAPRFVAGVMNLRGRALPVIDLRQRFRASAGNGGGKPRVVVVATEQLEAGFIVDGVSQILRVAEDALSAAPQLPGEETRMFDRVTVDGAGGPMILLVDPQELLNRAERDLLADFGARQTRKTPK